MQFTGKVLAVGTDWVTGQKNITFTINEPSAMNDINNLMAVDKLKIEAVKYRKKRSLDANGMLWACLGEIAAALRADKWDIYLQMLKRYGKYTYMIAKPEAVEGIRAMWRECEEIGDIDVNGQRGVQLLCYFGSSTYNTKEFSVLLEGVVSEMAEMGLPVPPSQEMRRALEELGKQHEKAV